MDDDKFVPHIEWGRGLAAVRIDGEDGGNLALVREAQDGELPVVADFGRLQRRRALDLVGEVSRPFDTKTLKSMLCQQIQMFLDLLTGGMRKGLKLKYKKHSPTELKFLYFHQNIIWQQNLKRTMPEAEMIYDKAMISRILFTFLIIALIYWIISKLQIQVSENI